MKPHIHLSLILLMVATLFSACQTNQRQREQANQTGNNQEQNTQKESKSEINQSKKNVMPVGADSLVKVFNEGKKIFNNNCTQCHAMTTDKVVGPGLKGVFDRRKFDWVKDFTRNSAKMIASGDSLAVAIFNEYYKVQMQPFEFEAQKMDKLLFYMANVGREKFITLNELRKQEK